MRLAGHTYAFRGLPVAGALTALEELRFDAVEVWLGHLDSDAAIETVRSRGLDVVAVSAGGYYESDTATPARAVEAAYALGAPRIVACVSPSRLREVAAAIPDDLELCVENHWDQQLARPGEVLRAIGALPSRVGACLDTGHALLAGVRPERFARGLEGRLRHVHLKDARPPHYLERAVGRRIRRRLLPRPEPPEPGTGALEISSLVAALSETGYTGTITAEDEGPHPQDALTDLAARWGVATMARQG